MRTKQKHPLQENTYCFNYYGTQYHCDQWLKEQQKKYTDNISYILKQDVCDGILFVYTIILSYLKNPEETPNELKKKKNKRYYAVYVESAPECSRVTTIRPRSQKKADSHSSFNNAYTDLIDTFLDNFEGKINSIGKQLEYIRTVAGETEQEVQQFDDDYLIDIIAEAKKNG